VDTLGFLSIVAFGGILSHGGTITSAIADDFWARMNLDIMTRPWASAIFWGTAYYLWMAVIAAVTVHWKRTRVDTDFSLRDGYWFAYMSSTTVGLGDIYLESEALIGSDIVLFSYLFLISFLFVAAFLAKFAETIDSFIGLGVAVQNVTDSLRQTAKERLASLEAARTSNNEEVVLSDNSVPESFHDAVEHEQLCSEPANGA
jgi:hypothetical protein